MRLFVGIPLDSETVIRLRTLQTKYLSWPGVHLERSNKLHLTLLYIGEVINEKPYIKVIKNISFKPFKMTLTGLAKFIKRQVVYFAMVNQNDELTDLANNILAQVLGVNPNINYRFTPHITLARSNKEYFYPIDSFNINSDIDRVNIYESINGQYRIIATILATNNN